jgi:hypothetical protein
MNDKHWRVILFFVLTLGIATASVALADSANFNTPSADHSTTLSGKKPAWTFYRSDPDLGRSGMRGVFDSHRRRVVMFGGERSGALDETWEFDGADWRQINTLHSPPARYGHGLAYDDHRQVAVLYGGYSLNDTWEYDGSDWTQVITANVPPMKGSMVYDSCRQQIVLYAAQFPYAGWVWEYDGHDWQEVGGHQVGYRPATAMAFDRGRCRTVLFGGLDRYPGIAHNDTWEYDGENWVEVAVSNRPPARGRHELAYDPTLGKIVLFGGVHPAEKGTLFADTWEYNGYNWVETTPAISPPAEMDHILVYDGNNQQVLFFGGFANHETWFYRGREPFRIYLPLALTP